MSMRSNNYLNNWHRVWSSRKFQSSLHGTLLEKLIAMDGFDSPLGLMKESEWRLYTDRLAKIASINLGDSIFEIGCGSGAFLLPFAEKGHEVGGIDYSEELINTARNAMPLFKSDFIIGDATQCDQDIKVDIVIANHVFHYFSSLHYASDVLSKMLTKTKFAVAVTGIPDFEFKIQSEQARQGILTPAEYHKKYDGLDILYFSRAWFSDFAKLYSFSTSFYNHEMPGFAQNEFRFDCVFRKM
jgi:trans-aconitate methyltransferase